ncbi:hypothetical protein AVEN_27743-1 [Araneus ventricosus]|uniref:Uncharacterized protein n=1 Tax=Araneus ventricosus TaxID=182803 RepID=A0A4Y2SCS0_ARAVE|nr:hypothetical protein AVEN_27743-1 [Araneus ventricosus]
MSYRVVHLAAEILAEFYDFSFLYGLQNVRKTDVIDFCMKMDLIAKEYERQTHGEKMDLMERHDLDDGFICCSRNYGSESPSC